MKNSAWAHALLFLAYNADNKVVITKAGGIPPLVALVRDGTALQKEHAAGALWNLAGDTDNRVAIAQAGGIPPLVALARDGTAQQKKEAAGALARLAGNTDNKVAIAQAHEIHDNLFADEVHDNLSIHAFAKKAGISSLLAEHGLSSEVAAAVSWFRTAGADTLRDVIEAGLQQDFVESIGFGKYSLLVHLPVSVRSYFGGLPPIKRGKLLRALQRMGAQEDMRMAKDEL